MLDRVFGLAGLLMALSYFVDGLTLLIRLYRGLGHNDWRALVMRFTSMSLDLSFALVLVVAAVGLFFAQRWARNMWLITMTVLATLHFSLTALHQLGAGVVTVNLMWTWMVVLLTAVSWWCFTRHTPASVSQPEGERVTEM
jgi:hypothetical protein